MRRFLPGVIVGWLLWVTACSAALSVPVSLAPADLDLGQRIAHASSHAVVRLAGRGDAIAIWYSASSPVDCVVVFADGRAVPDLSTSLVAMLPAGSGAEAVFDVSASPQWSPGTNAYQVFFFSRTQTGTSVERVSLTSSSLWRLPIIALRHSFTPEAYLPASYHRLKGYRMLSAPVPFVLLPVVVILFIAVLSMKRLRGKKLTTCLTVLAIASLLFSARFSLDLLRYTGRHLTAWYGRQPYEQAGLAYVIADDLRTRLAVAPTPLPVFLCSEGTSYIPALFTYLLSPHRVTQKPEEGGSASLLIAFQQPVHAEEGGAFRCGTVVFKRVKPLRTYADGSVVYDILPP